MKPSKKVSLLRMTIMMKIRIRAGSRTSAQLQVFAMDPAEPGYEIIIPQ